MKHTLLFFLSSLLFAEDPEKACATGDRKSVECPKEPTVAELKAELAQTKEALANTTKLLQAYATKYQQCDAQLISFTVLGPPKKQ